MAAFPSVGTLDDFNRANENPMVTASSGLSWTVTPDQGGLGISSFQVLSNQCSPNGASSFMYLNTTIGSNLEVAVTANNNPPANASFAIIARLTGLSSILTTNGYGITWTALAGTDTIAITKLTNGTGSNLVTFNQDVAIGDSFGISMIGSTLTAYYKASAGGWTVLGSTNDTSYTTSGAVALTGTNGGANINLFIGGTLAASSNMSLLGAG